MRSGGRRLPDEALSVYTIGHSNVELAAFVALLRQHGIEVLADVRFAPYSKFAPHFNRESLEPAVRATGVAYVLLGRELGGRPREAHYYDTGGRVRYDRLASSPAFEQGVERLLREARARRVAIMYNEENPAACHRRLLVGRVLAEAEVALRHIRADGRLQTEADLVAEGPRRAPEASQQTITFADSEVSRA